MNFALSNLLYTVGLLLGMLFLLEVGRRMGLRRMAMDSEGARAGVGAVEGAVFALLGLLIAFSFSGASSRFDARRQQIVNEANDIGSAYLLVDVLPAERQPALREKFRQYLDSRLEAYRRMPDFAAAKAEMERSKALQNEIWTQAVTASRDSGYQPVAMLILPAISKMMNITTERNMALQTHPPAVIFVMLDGLILVASLLAGYGMAGGKSRNWMYIVAFAMILAFTFYVIRDLEFPRLPGLVGLNDFDNVLVDLRKSMH
ncbi:MAG: DUF4239 domain-containing protein [Acidobacteria bacterium]|nr:DUF4239 domain-containing protein [Acidobacteriota bacterium]MBS1866858.1 DUF4239 domain-containing protein [Acidobacteriota bacterium]